MRTINVYETTALKGADGRDNVIVGCFVNECDAEAAGEQFKGPGGRKWHKVTPKTMVIYDTLEEYETARDEKILEQMKQRLTDEEKRVLRAMGAKNL